MEFIDDVVIPLALQYLYLRFISLFRHWCWAASYIFATMCYTVTPQPIVPRKRFISHQRSHWSESYSIIFCMENKQIEKNHATNCIETKAPKMISMKETKQPTWLLANAAFCIPYECSKYVLIESSWRASNMNCFSESNAKGMKWTIHWLFFFIRAGNDKLIPIHHSI